MTEVIKLKQLGLRTGNNFILKNIDWTIYEGEHWVLFGSNGSGKTTLLSIIAGYQLYTNGEMEVFGEQYDDSNLLSLRKKIGFISSSFFGKYYSRESALDVVLSGKSSTLGLSYDITSRDVKEAKKLLKAFNLNKIYSHPFNLLSNGERQRILVLRALMAKPSVFLFDEPCAGLDAFSYEYMLKFIKLLCVETKATVIFVTHRPEEITDEFEKCFLLRNGQMYSNGDTDNTFTTSKISGFFDYPVRVSKEGRAFKFNLDVEVPLNDWVQEKMIVDPCLNG